MDSRQWGLEAGSDKIASGQKGAEVESDKIDSSQKRVAAGKQHCIALVRTWR